MNFVVGCDLIITKKKPSLIPVTVGQVKVKVIVKAEVAPLPGLTLATKLIFLEDPLDISAKERPVLTMFYWFVAVLHENVDNVVGAMLLPEFSLQKSSLIFKLLVSKTELVP